MFGVHPPSVTLDEAIARLYDLNVGVIGVGSARHERPHKPLLLLAALDLIDEGKASPDRIPWCQDLRDRFTARFLSAQRQNDQNTPDNPFFYLQTDNFWRAWVEDGNERRPMETNPLVSQMGSVFARFTGGLELLAAQPATRQLLREALISRYFPRQWGDHTPVVDSSARSAVAEDSADFGRSPAFRRKILEIYDHQCAACGLRIKLPAGNDVSFIDAAHLIPFAESRNDHPTNGLALCKNHHWAMDREVIAPGPDHRWHVSKLIDSRRSNGEKDIAELAGSSVLLPQDPAFFPDEDGLAWRLGNLSA